MAISSDALTSRRAVEERLRGGQADVAGIALKVFLLLSLVISLGVLVILLTDIVVKAIPAFTERGTDLITAPLSARPARAGMSQGIIGSLILTGFVILIALPFGVGAAVYLEEYAHDTALTRFFRTNIRNLAGVPAIVYGLLGLAVFVTLLGLGQSAVAGGLTLGDPGAADRRDHHVRGPPRGPHLDPRGRLRGRRDPMGDDPLARPSVRRAGHPHRDDPGARARVRRDGAAHHGRRRGRRLQQQRPESGC